MYNKMEIAIITCSYRVWLTFASSPTSQVIKESVLGCLLDCLPVGVNRERISSATMKEAYVQKMVKVFNDHDRWSLISLSNNSGKNLELKFVSVLRRQFEFSVDSFQIILDRLLESYLQLETQQLQNSLESRAPDTPSKDCPSPSNSAAEKIDSMISGTVGAQAKGSKHSDHIQQPQEMEPLPKLSKQEEEVREQTELPVQETSIEELREDVEKPSETDFAEQISVGDYLENKQHSDDTELTHQTELLRQCSLKIKPLAQTQLHADDVCVDDSKQVERSEQNKELSDPIEVSVKNESSNDREPLTEHEKKGIHPLDPVEDSIPGETECLDTSEQTHNKESADEIFPTECSSEEQKINTGDDTEQLCVSDTCQSNDGEVEILTQLDGDSEKDSQADSQRMQTEKETDTETTTRRDPIRETTGVEQTSAIESPCSSASLTLTQSGVAGPTPETHSPLHTDSSENTVDPVNPTETQDTVSTQASLLSDKNISCLPSGKAANRLAQMVVLKHSSPKPPRRMCRKMTTGLVAGPVSGNETVIPAPDLEEQPSLSERETAPELDESRVSSGSADIKSTTADTMPDEVNAAPESPASSITSPDPNPEPPIHLSAPDPPPDLDPLSDVESFSPSPREPQASQIAEGLPEAPTPELKETLPSEVVCDAQSQIESSPNLLSQSEPPDSRDTLASSDSDRCCTPTQDHLLTSVAELSDDEATAEGPDDMVDLGPSMDLVCISLSLPVGEQSASSSPPSFHTASPSGSCLTPPMHCLSPPCATPTSPGLTPPTSPGLTPPLCLSPPPRCLTSPMLSISPPSSFSSTPLSFSPTSSGLSSPPYLTPPMLSLSPPPLCHSSPLLCLTPPVESEAPVSQVTPDLGPLVQNIEAEKSTPQPAVPLLSSPGDKDGDAFLSQTLVLEPALFPVSEAQAITSPGQTPVDSDPPKANDLSGPEARNLDALPRGASSDAPEQSKPPQLSGKVPAVEVLAESMYGDFEAAMDHLRYRLIATRNPEEIRGGGLLKYSNLLVRDYRPASETQIKTLERYMCSRFFIDFPDLQEQQRKILSYLKNHFIGEERSKYQYLMTLRRVVDDSTVCLMGHERRQTLNMITVLALKVLGEQNIIPNTDHVTCFYQPAPYLAEHSAPYLAEPSYCSYYIPQGGSTLLYQPYPLHLHSQTGLV